MRIPPHLREVLERFLPPGTPWDVEIVRGVPARGPSTFAALPMAGGLTRIGSARDGVITIHPEFWAPETAAGIALWAHEFYHQHQIAHVPNFWDRYEAEEITVERLGLDPWDNPFEEPAYQLEAEVYRALVADGWDPGGWVPVGVQTFA